MCGALHNRTGIFMLKSIRPAHDMAFEEADQPAEQGSNEMDDAVNLSQLKAELSYFKTRYQSGELEAPEGSA